MPECCGQAIEISDETELLLPVPWSCGHYVVELYNEIRTHLALSKSLLLSRAVQRSGALSPSRSCRDCTITTSGYNFRKGHVLVDRDWRLPNWPASLK